MNSFGRVFRVSLFGESHGAGIGVVVDGCPPGVELAPADFETDLVRRKSGAAGTTPRRESDIPSFYSGIHEGRTTGSPLCVFFPNSDTRSQDYSKFMAVPRPGHADFTSRVKYGGYSDPRGSGHFSGRVSTGLVVAGTIAKKLMPSVTFSTRLLSAGGSEAVDAAIAQAVEAGDSIGAVVEIRVLGLPPGLGEPFFDACESLIAHAVFAVPAVRGLEFGDSFASAAMRGSAHNDPFVSGDGKTSKNGAGGMNGGITNGNDLVLRVAVKPTSSISLPQTTFDFENQAMTTLTIEGRHDACIALRSAVVLESAVAVALADMFLTYESTKIRTSPRTPGGNHDAR